MAFYTAYGLTIQSVLPLPELIAHQAPPDVVIRLESHSVIASLMPPTDYSIGVFNDGIFFWWDDVGILTATHGREIVVAPIADVDEQWFRGFIINEAMAAMLHQRGKLVLHGSAAVIDDGVVVFIGRSGQGKSTTAAALQVRGHLAIVDDVVAIDLDYMAGVPHVLPAFPQVKLWPEAVAALGHDVDALPRVTQNTEKRSYRQAEGFPQSPQPLRAIYVLDKGDETHIEPLTPQQACFELLTHSYMNHLGGLYEVDLLGETGTAAANFQRCAEVARLVPIKRLTRRFSLPDLAQLVQLIEQDVAQGTAY